MMLRILFSAVLLSGCAHFADTESIHYYCNNGKDLYLTPDGDRATVRYDGHEMFMYTVVSASGLKYATEQGIRENEGFMVWSHGEELSAYHLTLDHSVTEKDKFITSCTLKNI